MKLNDRVFGRSPLSGLLELELLIAGVSGKLQLWRALAAVAPADSRLERFDFTALGERAERQRRRLEELHERTARKTLGGVSIAARESRVSLERPGVGDSVQDKRHGREAPDGSDQCTKDQKAPGRGQADP